MNINLNVYEDEDTGSSLQDDLKEHHEILARDGRTVLTGEVALVSVPDPDEAGLGAVQVWSKTADGMWVHVTPDGVQVEAACPLGD